MRVQVAVGSLDDKGVKTVTQINNFPTAMCVCGGVSVERCGVMWFTQLLNTRCGRKTKKKAREVKRLDEMSAGAQQFLFPPTPFGTVDEPFFPRFCGAA